MDDRTLAKLKQIGIQFMMAMDGSNYKFTRKEYKYEIELVDPTPILTHHSSVMIRTARMISSSLSTEELNQLSQMLVQVHLRSRTRCMGHTGT